MDIGGTFTDVVTYDDTTGVFAASKASTTPGNLSEGVLAGLDSVVRDPADIGFLVHGTTQGLNAFLERRGVPVLLLATAGVEDSYHIARGPRTRLYDLHYRKPESLVRRRDVIGIGGRITADGAELAPLDEDAVRARPAAPATRSTAPWPWHSCSATRVRLTNCGLGRSCWKNSAPTSPCRCRTRPPRSGVNTNAPPPRWSRPTPARSCAGTSASWRVGSPTGN